VRELQPGDRPARRATVTAGDIEIIRTLAAIEGIEVTAFTEIRAGVWKVVCRTPEMTDRLRAIIPE
jgi:hypothetical protein